MFLFVSIMVYLGVPEDIAENGIAGLFAFLTLALWIWGQFDRKDVVLGVFRK